MKKGKFLTSLLSFVLIFSMASCNEDSVSPSTSPSEQVQEITKLESDSLYVKKIDNISDDFIFGMDASSVLAQEKSGVKYYDYNGNETDVFKTLAQSGVNYIRVRIWNDPFDANGNGYGGGNCDINTAVEIGKRATANGMKLLVNFHYSDFWADPAKQMVPKAWKGMEIEEKAEALYKYTVDSLNKLKEANVDVGMVQMGNETNSAMSGEKTWMNIAYHLMGSSSKAIREVFPEALIAVHFANPEKVGNYANYASKLDYYKLDYDVFASSYYSYWHGTLDNLSTVLSEIATKYNKKVMVMETSYAYTSEDSDFFGNTISDGGAIAKNYPFTVQGQANAIWDVIDTMVNKTTNGIGVCYWEGTWNTVGTTSWEENNAKWEQYGSGWATSYSAEYDPNDAGKYYGGNSVDNQALFDKEGKPLESLKLFNLVRFGNEVEVKADAITDTTIICDLNGKLVLPEKVSAIMNDNSKKEIDVTWHNVDFDAMYNGGVQKYDIVGTAGGMEAHCYVSMVEFNFLQNYSFEDGELNGWVINEIGKADELGLENNLTDSLTGNYHVHFWSAASDSVEFSVEQKVENLPTGKYKYSISIMGGDAGTTDIYAYVKINGEIVAKDTLAITSYGSWDTSLIENINYTEGQEIVVGIYVKCSGSGNGAWGKIDDALLNSQAE